MQPDFTLLRRAPCLIRLAHDRAAPHLRSLHRPPERQRRRLAESALATAAPNVKVAHGRSFTVSKSTNSLAELASHTRPGGSESTHPCHQHLHVPPSPLPSNHVSSSRPPGGELVLPPPAVNLCCMSHRRHVPRCHCSSRSPLGQRLQNAVAQTHRHRHRHTTAIATATAIATTATTATTIAATTAAAITTTTSASPSPRPTTSAAFWRHHRCRRSPARSRPRASGGRRRATRRACSSRAASRCPPLCTSWRSAQACSRPMQQMTRHAPRCKLSEVGHVTEARIGEHGVCTSDSIETSAACAHENLRGLSFQREKV
eukprot:6150878-Pleurochrysis_carterae.AAC.2